MSSLMNAMPLLYVRSVVLCLQYAISLAGILIIVSGIAVALTQYIKIIVRGDLMHDASKLNHIRLDLARIFLLGLEFIVAADLIATTTTPDYYALGLAAIIVLIRTLLSYSLSRELTMVGKK